MYALSKYSRSIWLAKRFFCERNTSPLGMSALNVTSEEYLDRNFDITRA